MIDIVAEALKNAGIKYFSAKEITWARQWKKRQDVPPELIQNAIPTLNIGDAIRSSYGKPVGLYSFFRSKEYNTQVGGAKSSEHMEMKAGDFYPIDGDMQRFYLVATEEVVKFRLQGWNVGLIYYDKFIHIDVNAAARKGKSRTIDNRGKA